MQILDVDVTPLTQNAINKNPQTLQVISPGSVMESIKAAIIFYKERGISVAFKMLGPAVILTTDADLGAFHYKDGLSRRANSVLTKGIDLLVVPNWEGETNGVTILPNKKPPDGFAENLLGTMPEPNPTRPIVILNAARATAVPIALLHELGHALLNTTAHSDRIDNFMLGDPPHGKSSTKKQNQIMLKSQWLRG